METRETQLISYGTEELEKFVEALERHNINYWLDSGTLLGIKRDGHLLTGDNDLDFGVWFENRDQLEPFIREYKELGYKVYSQSYSGDIYKYEILLDQQQLHTSIEIKLYRKDDGFAWCPSAYWGSSHPHKKTNGTADKNLIYYAQKAAKIVLRKILTKKTAKQFISTNRFPLTLIYGINTWWIPARFFETVEIDYTTGYRIPAQWEEYLEFRYGSWRTPVKSWDFRINDAAYKHQSPVKLLTSIN